MSDYIVSVYRILDDDAYIDGILHVEFPAFSNLVFSEKVPVHTPYVLLPMKGLLFYKEFDYYQIVVESVSPDGGVYPSIGVSHFGYNALIDLNQVMSDIFVRCP